ncbi:MAG: DUF3795 domain-containing protein [Clostridia bacterium]|nr:DUF3795 domain-containing protein [Clostridia bacterium]
MIDETLLGKCGFYCGSCPTYAGGNCSGCVAEHQAGDCYTLDCVQNRGLAFCGECPEFPCETLLNEPRTTVLDKEWLNWKKASHTNR